MKYANAALSGTAHSDPGYFELGLNAARSNAENSPILAGMDMVAKQLNDFLFASGVEP